MRSTSAIAASAPRRPSVSESAQICSSLTEAIAEKPKWNRGIVDLILPCCRAAANQNVLLTPVWIHRAEKGSSPGLPSPPRRQCDVIPAAVDTGGAVESLGHDDGAMPRIADTVEDQ